MKKYDIIVVGAGPGGIPAAIAAARKGKKVLLVERENFLGGMLVSGVPIIGFLDRQGNHVVKGIAQEIIDRLSERGGTPGHARVPVHNSLTMMHGPWTRLILTQMCMAAGVECMLCTQLHEVIHKNNRIEGVRVLCRNEIFEFETNMLIDATGDAWAAMLAGIPFEKGEKLQPPTLTFEVSGINMNEFYSYLKKHPETYKLPDTFSDVSQNEEMYDDDKVFSFMGFPELIEKAKKNGEFHIPRNMIDFCRVPNSDRAFLNVTRAINADVTVPESLIRAIFECENQIIELMDFLKKYAPGFENCKLESIIPFLGTRESRRTVCRKTLTVKSLDTLDIPDDTIALAGYNVDIHGQDSGSMTYVPISHAIGIPYDCMIPQEMEGFIASGRTISVDQTVFAMTRVMATCMAVSQAAGTAACIALDKGISLSEINVSELREELVKDGCVVSL